MSQSLNILLASAATVGLLHTVIGPDHYLPFIVLGRAEGWTLRKTMFWTFICGVGHVASSIVLGFLGVGLGWALSSLTHVEAIRGDLAAWALIVFGFVYFVWGLWRSWNGHSHVHAHADGSLHDHPHPHDQPIAASGHDQPVAGRGHEQTQHDEAAHVARHRRTLWVLFTIFVLGPCEPLIPLLMAPAARHDMVGVAAVAGVFGSITVGMMMVLVALGTLGVRLIRVEALERHVHALAGFAIFVSGLLIQILGV